MAAGSAILVGVGSLGAVADDLIRSKDIVDDTVRSKDVNDGTLRSKDVRKNALKKGDIRRNAVGGSELIDGSIKEKELSDDVLALLNQAGVPGPQGEVGPMGPVGPRGSAGDPASDLLGALVKHESHELTLNDVVQPLADVQAGPKRAISIVLDRGTYVVHMSAVPSTPNFGFLGLGLIADQTEGPMLTGVATGMFVPVVNGSVTVSVDEETTFRLLPFGDVEGTFNEETETVDPVVIQATLSAVRVLNDVDPDAEPGDNLPAAWQNWDDWNEMPNFPFLAVR